MDLNLSGRVPVINGVLHCFTEDQALDRAGLKADGSCHNHGVDFALAALQQVAVKRQLGM